MPDQPALCWAIGGNWSSDFYSLDLDAFMTDLLPMLDKHGIHPGVFFAPDRGSIDITIDQLQKDLQQELNKYEWREPMRVC